MRALALNPDGPGPLDAAGTSPRAQLVRFDFVFVPHDGVEIVRFLHAVAHQSGNGARARQTAKQPTVSYHGRPAGDSRSRRDRSEVSGKLVHQVSDALNGNKQPDQHHDRGTDIGRFAGEFAKAFEVFARVAH